MPEGYIDSIGTTGKHLLLSDTCVQRLQSICKDQNYLRVSVNGVFSLVNFRICRIFYVLQVEGGGCSGFQYKFELEKGDLGEEDRLFEREGAKVVTDEQSLEYLDGSTVDYHTELIRAAFRIVDNPLAEQVRGSPPEYVISIYRVYGKIIILDRAKNH